MYNDKLISGVIPTFIHSDNIIREYLGVALA